MTYTCAYLSGSRALLKAAGLLVVLFIVAGCGAGEAVPTGTVASTETLAPSPSPTALPTPSVTPTAAIPEPERPLLLAHYMPWYQTPAVSGYWGWHWTMDHFQPSRLDEQGRPEIASYYMPLTGPYDSRDDALLEYQVLLMKISGIDGVIVDWYGIEDFWDYAVLNDSTHKLFTYVKKADLRFAICYEDQTVKHMVDNKHLPVDDIHAHGQSVMRYLEATWFRDDTYLKVLDRPVLLVFGPQYFKQSSDWDQLFSVLETRPALITLDGHTETAGLSSFPWPPMWAATDGELDQATLTRYLTSFYQKAERWDYLVAGAFPGFRDIYAEAGIATETRYLDPRDGETFRLTLQLALDQHPHVIQLITWNDYGESTTIEPTEEYGYRYLEMVQEVRRTAEGASFPFTPDDLRLPLALYELREHYAGDDEVNASLDRVFDAVVGNDAELAWRILDEFARVP